MAGKYYSTLVKSFSGATSRDVIDFVKPLVSKNPDVLIIHAGTNYMTKNIKNTAENFQSIINCIKDKSSKTEIVLSNVCLRDDRTNLLNQRIVINGKLHDIAEAISYRI